MTVNADILQSWDGNEAWRDIQAVFNDPEVKSAIQARERFEEKYCVHGVLLVTTTQYEQLTYMAYQRDLAAPAAYSGSAAYLGIRSHTWGGIPIKVIPENGIPVELGNDLKAVYAYGSIYVFKEVDWSAQIDQAPLSFFPHRGEAITNLERLRAQGMNFPPSNRGDNNERDIQPDSADQSGPGGPDPA